MPFPRIVCVDNERGERMMETTVAVGFEGGDGERLEFHAWEKKGGRARDKISGLLDPPLQNLSDRKAFLGMKYLSFPSRKILSSEKANDVSPENIIHWESF